MRISKLSEQPSFTTADGSTIRELLNPRNSALLNQSLAEATLLPGQATAEHYHPRAEEIYFILSGRGQMTVERETRAVGVGDAIAIPNGQRHTILNDGAEPLIFLCCCSPAYTHEDTILVR